MSKSSHHKLKNTYRFVSFNERISNITINVIHQIRRVDDDPTTTGTYFGECLRKWTELDLTEQFTTFRLEISQQVQTYEQLVHHEAEIIAALKTHLEIQKSPALPALLELLVQLARDLQQDFLPHMQVFFSLLVKKLEQEKQDADILENIFQTLALLFRMLWRYLVKDFKQLFGYFSELLISKRRDYIKVFASESCAYLLRKVKKKNDLLNYLFRTLKTSPELTDGVGLLLFEMLKGVKMHFHTSSEEVFPLILHKLGPWSPNGKDTSLPRAAVERAVTVMMQDCAEHSTKETCGRLWNLLLDCTKQVHKACVEIEATQKSGKTLKAYTTHLCRLLRMISLWVTHKKGKVISDPGQIASTLLVIAKSPCCADILGPELLQTVSNVLILCDDRLKGDTIVKLVSLAFELPVSLSELQAFLMTLVDTPFFEKDVLLCSIKRADHELQTNGPGVKDETLAFIASVVLEKRSFPTSGDEVLVLEACPMDVLHKRGAKSYPFADLVTDVLQEASVSDNQVDVNTLWAATVIAPHLRIPNIKECFVNLWRVLFDGLKRTEDSHSALSLLFVMDEVLKGILIKILPEKKEMPLDVDDIYHILRSHPTVSVALHIVDLFLSYPECDDHLTAERLAMTYSVVEQNFTSPSHYVRLLTCHILSLFPVELPDYGDDISRDSVFQILWSAESIEPTIQTYRDKLIYLQKLEYNAVAKCLPIGDFHKAPLLFLLGNEFWNFKLLWGPLTDIITTHAYGLGNQDFWPILLHQLERAAAESSMELRQAKNSQKQRNSDDENSMSVNSLMTNHKTNFLKDERSADYTLYRVNLWKLMKKFPDKCSQRSEDLCPLYLNFLKLEFPSSDGNSKNSQNIMIKEVAQALAVKGQTKKKEEDKEVDMETDGDQIDADDDGGDVTMETNNSETEDSRPSHSSQRKATVQSLLVHLDLFALFKKHGPFLKEEVQQTFYDFLLYTNGAVQKAAFDVICTYKSRHILPYKENFHRLLDDDTFKTEIIFFRVDEESSTLNEEDREGLMPVLMRILYGKILGKAGRDTSGRSRGDVRRSLVLRFLGGCKPEELKYFIDLLFRSCSKFCSGDPQVMVHNVIKDLDLRKIMPLKKMQGILSTIHMVTQQLGHRLEWSAHTVLQILLGMAATLIGALNRREDIFVGYINLLKSLKHEVLDKIVQFFHSYDNLDFTESEMKAVFDAVVWSQAGKLVLEGVHHPTPLLKLYTAWSNSYRLLPLLGWTKEIGGYQTEGMADNDEAMSTLTGLSPLSSALTLLNAPAIKFSVVTSILDIVQQLLMTEEEWDIEGELEPLPGNFECSLGKGKEIGQTILRPGIPLLLKFLQSRLGKLSSHSKEDRKYKPSVELKILARISSFVTSPKQCQSLCSLLIPYLTRSKGLKEEVEENTLRSATNLMQYVDNPIDFYKMTSQLFGTVERRESRVLLCHLFKTISANVSELSELAVIVEKLNSWDHRKAEEPDYSSRLEAFQQLNVLINNTTTVDMNLILPAVYNCSYFIAGVDDLSIRDNSTFFITTLIKKVAELDGGSCTSKIFQTIISDILVKMVRIGIRSKMEAVRHEFIAILQCLVTTYPESRLFAGLSDLNDKDPEANYFENIRHIQIYKRARGIRRVYRYLNNHTLSTDIHVSYFIPLIYSFITEPHFAKHGNIQDGAVDLLGTICKQLPWGAYSNILDFYLRLLPKMVDNQRQVIRIIVALLNGFHFDLNKSTFKERFFPHKNKKQTNDSNNTEEGKQDGTGKGENDNAVDNEKDKDETVDDTLPTDLGVTEMEEGQVVMEKKDTSVKVKSDTGNRDHLDDDEEEVVERKVVMTVCTPEVATKIHQTIVKTILPQLHSAITQRNKSETEHKSVRSQQSEDEVLRVPLALAVIKLLQQLPKGTLEMKLPGVLLKICNFLRSRCQDVRSIARETLVKAAMSLGPRFFPFILKEMMGCLERGYQLHVLSFTTYHLLKNLLPIFTPGDLDPAIESIHAIHHRELFGFVAEEKEVKAIKAKFFEAKVMKAYESYEIMAKLISASRLENLIKPIREMLMSTHSQRIAKKADAALKKIAAGLTSNPSIPLPAMMVFINSLTTKLVPDLVEVLQPMTGDALSVKPGARESCLVLEKELPRGGAKPKVSKRTNIHILMEFGLQMLHSCLKQMVLQQTNHLYLQMLDPLVPAVIVALDDPHARTNANAMRCVVRLLKFSLPTLHKNIEKIAKSMFLVLQNYVGAVRAKGDNLELITMTFKAITVVVREVTTFKLSTEQLQVLLTYCEEDLYNYDRQSTAFDLIKSILTRKMDIPQLHDVVQKLFDLSISATSTDTRMHGRQLVAFYLMNYPHSNIQKHIQFYLDHLQFELEDGRASALEMLITMFTSFPATILNKHCIKIFLPLAMASYNDDSVKCRKLIVVALKMLFGKVNPQMRKTMFHDTFNWIKSEDYRLRAMGCHVCGLFIEVEGGDFSIHQTSLLPVLQRIMDPAKYPTDDDSSSDLDVEKRDVCLLAVISLFLKVVKELNPVRVPQFKHHINLIWNHLSFHVLYPQFQVRLVSSQALGIMFNDWEPQDMVVHPNKDTTKESNKLDKVSSVNGVEEEKMEEDVGMDKDKGNDVEEKEDKDSGNEDDMEVVADVSNKSRGNDDKNDDGGAIVKKSKAKKKKKHKPSEGEDEIDYLLNNTVERMKSLCLSFCYQLRTPEIDSVLATQIIKNLLYITRVAEALKNVDLLVWVAKKIMREANYEVTYNVKHTSRRTHTFKWAAAVGVTLTQESVLPILPVVLPYVQRELAEESIDNEELKTLSQEVVDLLKKQVGVQAFTNAYIESQRARQQKRDNRKRQWAEAAVTDPAMAARRKVQKTWKKDAAKKRKMEDKKLTKRIKKSKISILNMKVDDDL